MYLVVIAVLAIVLTFPTPPYKWLTAPSLTLSLVALATLIPPAVGFFVNRLALRRFEIDPEHPSHGQFVFGRGVFIIQNLLALCHIAVLFCTNWMDLCRQTAGVWLLLPGLLAMVPFLFSILLTWIMVYPSDRAIRQLAVEIYLFRNRPLRPVWSLGQYLMFNLRHQVLFILVPMLFILAARDAVVHYDEQIRAATGQEFAGDILLGCSAIVVALIAPEVLRHIWVTQRLPDGPLRDRLQTICKKLNMRCREILVWRSGGMIVNAAVMGVVAPMRYVLITDAMLEQLDDTKIEAVFGHEAGHVKRHHILFFLLFALISGCIVTIFSAHVHGMTRTEYQIAAAVLGALLLCKWGMLFGWVSRRFERQADVFGVRTLALSGLPCTLPCKLHADDSSEQPSPYGDKICATAAQVFSHALNEVALLNGMRPEARSWRHSSISSRSRFVQRLAGDPEHTRRFERLVLTVKVVIFALAATASVWACVEIRLWESVLEIVRRLWG